MVQKAVEVGLRGAASLAFVGPVATAFAYWAVVETGRHFRSAVLSMTLLAAPTLGILVSAITLGENIGTSLIAGVLLIAAGIRLVTAESRRYKRLNSEFRLSTLESKISQLKINKQNF